MLDPVHRVHKLGLRIFKVYGGRLKIGMGCQIHALVDRNAQHRPRVPAVKAAYIGAAAEEADPKRRPRRDHDCCSRIRMAPRGARMMSTASFKSWTR